MPANMNRLAQVCGMSTRESLDRPRQGITHAFQRIELNELRLNKAATSGFDARATTVWTRGKTFDGKRFENSPFPRQESIYATTADVKHLLWACRKADADWQPSRFAKRADREHPVLKSRGLLG
jgi:hypothetical protein